MPQPTIPSSVLARPLAALPFTSSVTKPLPRHLSTTMSALTMVSGTTCLPASSPMLSAMLPSKCNTRPASTQL